MRPPPQWWMMVGLILNCEMTVKCTSLLNIAKQTNEIQTIVALRPRCPSSTKLGSQPSESRKPPWCGCDKRHEVQHDLWLHVRPLQVISNDWWLLCSCDSDISIKFWYHLKYFEVTWFNLTKKHHWLNPASASSSSGSLSASLSWKQDWALAQGQAELRNKD